MTQETFLNLPFRIECLRINAKWRCESRSPGGVFFTADLPEKDVSVTPLDIWAERDAFLRLKWDDLDGLEKFLNRVGLFDLADIDDALWDERVGNSLGASYRNRMYEFFPQPFRDDRHFFEMSLYISELMTDAGWEEGHWRFGTPANPRGGFSVRFDQRANPAAVVLTTTTFFDAVFLSLQIDRLRGAKYQKCAREACGIHFAVTDKRKRKYCCWNCGHYETVRRSRTKKKSA